MTIEFERYIDRENNRIVDLPISVVRALFIAESEHFICCILSSHLRKLYETSIIINQQDVILGILEGVPGVSNDPDYSDIRYSVMSGFRNSLFSIFRVSESIRHKCIGTEFDDIEWHEAHEYDERLVRRALFGTILDANPDCVIPEIKFTVLGSF